MNCSPGLTRPSTDSWLDRIARRLLNLLKRWYANYIAVPANNVMGVRIVEVSSDSSRVVVRLKNVRSNRNAAGTVHGAAPFALAETVHGAAVLWQFSPSRHTMFTKTASLDFVVPGRGELVVNYSLGSEILDRMRRELADLGRCEVAAESHVVDMRGVLVARLRATYVVLRDRKRRSDAAA